MENFTVFQVGKKYITIYKRYNLYHIKLVRLAGCEPEAGL